MTLLRDHRTLFVLTVLLPCMLPLGCKDETTTPDDNLDHVCEHWMYTGEEGPDRWKDLCVEYADCGGTQQSPVDVTGAVTDLTLGNITFNYDSSATAIVNNGHTIQWNDSSGSSITYRGTTYTLEQFHLHTPAEHTVSGTTYPMELHMVHKDSATGKLAVVGVLFIVGTENTFLTQFMDNLPIAAEGTYDNAAKYLAADALPAARAFFTYSGSLTTPPCSEIVTWLVLQTPVRASQAQLDALKDIMHSNNRPLQPLNGRPIKSN